MNRESFLVKASEYLTLNGVLLDDECLSKLFRYYELTLLWGLKMNITTNLDATPYFRENFLDPILGLQKIHFQGCSVTGLVDLGAGGGYVGLTASIIFPQLKHCLLVESVRKKVSFMQMVIRELNLNQTQAVQARAEEVCVEKCHFDTIVSRATWSWDKFEEISDRFFREGINAFSFEGPKAHSERKIPHKNVLSYDILPFDRRRHLYCKYAA